MTVYEAIEARRSIRKFKPDEVPEAVLRKVLEAARLAPSGCAREARKLIVVRDQETKEKLAVASPVRFPGPAGTMHDKPKTQILEAPVVIVGCNIVQDANLSYQGFDDEEYVVFSNRTREPEDPGFWPEYTDHAKTHDGEYESMGIWDLAVAMDHLSLAAQGEGLGTCWIGIVKERPVRKILNIPDTVQARMMMVLGYPDMDPDPRPRKPFEEVVSFDRWS